MLYFNRGEIMNLLFISDIHGIKTNLSKIKERFDELKCEKLIVLGDLFYIGPRNNMIEGYDIDYVKNFLNSFLKAGAVLSMSAVFSVHKVPSSGFIVICFSSTVMVNVCKGSSAGFFSTLSGVRTFTVSSG